MATSKTSEIILGRVEYINASHFNCLSFAKASDMVNGINVRLSNMASGVFGLIRKASVGTRGYATSDKWLCCQTFYQEKKQ